ncbi:MAG: cytochrome d ubiquinol oxidase subunit II [Pseudomonadales bacterium]|jgi:cytochrome d ubiquinol oxidase subunit II|nr:cytochrome d ubiquinol oxidase subunit II [Pseudomonadales bacterium]
MLDLPTIWAGILGFAVLAYVVMDGFDLGIGILFPLFPEREHRDRMVNTIAPVWDGNETWLILGGGGLFAVFPLAYSVLMTAFYAPLILMLLALIFRGVAFEFRFKVHEESRRWDLAFMLGSMVATFCQGIVLGAFIQGIAVDGRSYAGGWFDWLTPFSIFTGLALLVGYALLGACWINLKTDGALQAHARTLALRLNLALLGAIGIASLWTPLLSPEIAARWFTLPQMLYLSPVPLAVLAAAWAVHRTLQRGREWVPFLLAIGLFVVSFAGLGVSLYPYAVPRAITLAEAAGPDSSLSFLLAGTVVLVPLILIYTAHAYWVFRGKISQGEVFH